MLRNRAFADKPGSSCWDDMCYATEPVVIVFFVNLFATGAVNVAENIRTTEPMWDSL
jgi:hypothetical protein